MLPISCQCLLFLSAFFPMPHYCQSAKLHCQSKHLNIHSFICMWANFYDIGEFKRQQSQPFQSGAIHPIRLQYNPFSSLSSIPLQLTPKTPRTAFRYKWCFSPPVCLLSPPTMSAWYVTNMNFKHPTPLSKSQAYNHLAPSSQDPPTHLAQLLQTYQTQQYATTSSAV